MMHFINHSFIPFRFIPHFQLFVLIPDSWRLTDDRGWGFAAMVSFELASFLSSNPENDEISDRQVCKHWLALWFQTSFKRVAMEMQIMQLLWCQRLLLQRFRGSGPRRVRSMWRERRLLLSFTCQWSVLPRWKDTCTGFSAYNESRRGWARLWQNALWCSWLRWAGVQLLQPWVKQQMFFAGFLLLSLLCWDTWKVLGLVLFHNKRYESNKT